MKFTHDDVLVNKFQPNILVEVDHIKEMMAIGEEIYSTIERKYKALAIVPEGLTVTKEARELGSTKLANRNAFSSAVVINSLAHRILGNFMKKGQKYPIPFKLFNSKEAALKWLSVKETGIFVEP